jgi:hypothetical protein
MERLSGEGTWSGMQSGFFEHRLRTQAEYDEKASYVRKNPVRKGLVTAPELWPYFMDRTNYVLPEQTSPKDR